MKIARYTMGLVQAAKNKYLKTFTAQTGTAKLVQLGVNMSNLVLVEFVCPAGYGATDTIALTLPSGLTLQGPVAGKDVVSIVPLLVQAWSAAAPRVKSLAADLVITSFDPTTNIVTLTCANNALPTSATISLLCAVDTLRT